MAHKFRRDVPFHRGVLTGADGRQYASTGVSAGGHESDFVILLIFALAALYPRLGLLIRK